MSGAGSVLAGRGLWAVYGSTRVLQGVDIEVRSGDAIGIVGRSGIGKSTLLEILGGGMRPGRGTVTLDGRQVRTRGLGSRGAMATRVRTVHQNAIAGLDPQLTAGRTITRILGQARKSGRSTGLSVPDVLVAVDLPPSFADRPVRTLSGGERQRLALAGGLATRPDILLLDEPLTAVDPGQRGDLAGRLAAHVAEQGVGLVIASHDMRLVERLTRTVHVLADGALVESGPLREVLASPQHPDTVALAESLGEATGSVRPG